MTIETMTQEEQQLREELLDIQDQWECWSEVWEDAEESGNSEEQEELQDELSDILDQARRGAESSLDFLPDDMEVSDFEFYNDWMGIVWEITDQHGGAEY